MRSKYLLKESVVVEINKHSTDGILNIHNIMC